MGTDRQATIGVFVFGGLVLAVGALVLFGNFRLFSRTDRAAIVFQGSISGLSVGAPVTFRGVRVGAVESIALQFDPQSETAYIPVIVQLDPSRVHVAGEASQAANPTPLSTMVDIGLRAELNVQSFVTGQSQIELDFDRSSPAVLHPNVTTLPEIPTRLSTIQRVQEQLSQLPLRELVSNADATLRSLQSLSAQLNVGVPALIASIRTTSDGASRTVDAATSAISDLQARLDTTLTGVSQLAATSDRQVSARGEDLHALLISTSRTMQRTDAILNDLASLTSSRGEARGNLEATLRDLAAAAASLRGFASDVESNPQLLLTGRRP